VDCSRFPDAGRLRNPEKPYSFFFQSLVIFSNEVADFVCQPQEGPGAEAMHIRADRAVVAEAI
jgi:hypothetical protein